MSVTSPVLSPHQGWANEMIYQPQLTSESQDFQLQPFVLSVPILSFGIQYPGGSKDPGIP